MLSSRYYLRPNFSRYQSYVYGQIDGFFDFANPFEGMHVFGYNLSVPNLGAIEGHEFAYTVGYVQGAVAGVVAQIGLGVVSGGASAPACAGAIAKVFVAAARVYTFVDTVAAVGHGIQQAHNLATNSGNMTGWQIAGNVAMIGLNFAPALGAAGGVALKKLIGPDFLKLGGCFVAGTKVHLSALPVAISQLELAYASSASDRHSYDLGFAWKDPHAEPAIVVPIEQVPLGSRIATKNPEAFGAENPIPDANESTWRLLSAEIEREDGARVEVELLRPLAWIEQQGFEPGARIYLELEELNVAGWATIRNVDPCPSLSDGHGNLVTGRFVTRGATNLVEATFSDGTVLNGTSIHPVWSLDRMEWIPLGELAIGEQVYSNDGPLHLIARTVHNQPTDVYNIEVDCEHVYQVGDAGILVHNTCDTHMMGRIGERLAADVLQKRGWTVLGGLTRGNNGLDLIAQKNIGGKLQTLLIEVKVNGSRLSELQKLGPRRYAEDVLRRFTDAGLANRTLVQNLIDSGTEIRGLIIRMDWRSGDLIEKLRRWYN